MAGVGARGGNDRTGYRIDLIEATLLELYDSARSCSRGLSRDISYRVSVIDFGTRASVAVSMERVFYDPSVSERVNELRVERIKRRIRARSLGDTDHRQALHLVGDEVDKLRTASPAAPRPVLVVLITDGQPYVEGFDLTRYLNSMRTEVERRLSAPGLVLWVLGLADAYDDYWRHGCLGGCGRYWSTLATGNAKLIDSGFSLPDAVRAILEQRIPGLPRKVPVNGSDFIVPPYTREIVVSVTRRDPSDTIQLWRPDGSVVPPHQYKTFGRRKAYLRTRIENPSPGRWRVSRTNPKDVKVDIEYYYQAIKLGQPRGIKNVLQSIVFAYKVSGRKGEAFREDSKYPVQASLRVEAPDGSAIQLPLHTDGGAFKSKPFTPHMPGEYALKLLGDSRLLDGTPVRVLESGGEVMVVSDKNPVQLLLLEPEGRVGTCFFRRTFPVRLRLVKYQEPRTPFPVAQAIDNPANLVEVRVYEENGRPVSDPTRLSYNGREFVGEVSVDLTPDGLRALLKELARTGGRTLHFEVNEQAVHEDYFVHSIAKGSQP